MKKGLFCPECGTRGLRNLFITTQRGKSLSLLLASQADIRSSNGEAYCVPCKIVKSIAELQNTPPSTINKTCPWLKSRK
jgi:hypothetical protein